jgi:DNA polymerase III subunit delta'
MLSEPCRHDFSTIAGHEVIKRYLLRAQETVALPHAFLFHGPEGIGKTSMAYALAKLVNCPSVTGGKCTCEACRKISEGVFADLLLVEPKGAAGQITLAGWKPGKDDPDGPQYYRFVDSLPMEGRRKIIIIRRADRMNVSLANYLLKLIEEPPSYLILILVTHRPGDLLVTIRSRCSPLKFVPLVADEMIEYGKLLAPDRTPADLLAAVRLAEGRPARLAELLAGSTVDTRGEVGELLRTFQQHGFISLFRVASDLLAAGASAKRGDGYEQALDAMQAWLRDAMIMKTLGVEKAGPMIVNADAAPEVARYADAVTIDKLAEAIDLVRSGYEYVPRVADKNFVLENMLLKIGRAMRG